MTMDGSVDNKLKATACLDLDGDPITHCVTV